jgi:hypothetical protein
MPQLPRLKVYPTKKRIINFIVNNESLPTKFKLKEEFEGITFDQLNDFKKCNKHHKGISFTENDLF